MNSIDKKELKVISYEFRSLANRVLNCNSENAIPLIRRMIAFIDQTEIIHDYVHGYADMYTFDPPQKGQRYLYLGDTLEEEVAEGYNYFSYISKECKNFAYDVAIYYGSNDGVKVFCNEIVHPFISDIIDYLTKIEIQMGLDETQKYYIVANGENIQVNIAEQNANQDVVQSNGIDIEKLQELLSRVKETSDDSVDKDIDEAIGTINEELEKGNPNKTVLKNATEALKCIKGTAEFMAAVTTLIQFIEATF